MHDCHYYFGHAENISSFCSLSGRTSNHRFAPVFGQFSNYKIETDCEGKVKNLPFKENVQNTYLAEKVSLSSTNTANFQQRETMYGLVILPSVKSTGYLQWLVSSALSHFVGWSWVFFFSRSSIHSYISFTVYWPDFVLLQCLRGTFSGSWYISRVHRNMNSIGLIGQDQNFGWWFLEIHFFSFHLLAQALSLQRMYAQHHGLDKTSRCLIICDWPYPSCLSIPKQSSEASFPTIVTQYSLYLEGLSSSQIYFLGHLLPSVFLQHREIGCHYWWFAFCAILERCLFCIAGVRIALCSDWRFTFGLWGQ